MLAVLNMDLEPVRVVLSNEVNRITVCEDRRRAQGGLYTVVSVTAPHARRDAARLTAAGAFGGSADFVGSAALGDALHLVFRYRPESLLASRESIYGVDFVHRRTMAANFLAAAAGTQLPPDAAMLLLAGCCINLGESGEVYFNYYLDFADYRPETTQPEFCRAAAAYVFDILCRDYARSAGGQIPDYPGELQAFYRKTQVGGFTSLGALLAAVRALPDAPRPPAPRAAPPLGQHPRAAGRDEKAFAGHFPRAARGRDDPLRRVPDRDPRLGRQRGKGQHHLRRDADDR